MSNWQRAAGWGILRSPNVDDPNAAFHAGHLNDALRIELPPANPLLVASETSGVWLVNEDGGPAIPLSWNWDKEWGPPKLNCLAPGFFGKQHVYAGGSRLWETDTTQPAPLFSWREIPLINADDPNKRFKIGNIFRVVAVGQRGTVVLATDAGVLWAKIPNPGGNYLFKRAKGLPGQIYSSVAEGPNTSIVAGAWGSDEKTHFGIFVGTWSGTDLVFSRSSIAGGIDKRMLRTEIVAFPGLRQVLYAVCADSNLMTPVLEKGAPKLDSFGNIQWQDPGDQDPILSVLKSTNGGLSWTPTGSTITGKAEPLFPAVPGNAIWAGVGQGGYNICIGVSPFDQQIVAVGMNNFLLSVDGGDNWQLFRQEDGYSHLHPDIHGLFFDQTDPSRLYVCSDGGLGMTPDLGSTWSSQANRQLPNLEGYRFAPSPQDPGVLAFSMQDNGNIYTSLYINANPWTEADGGDGRISMMLSSGRLVRTNNDADQDGPGGKKVSVGQAARASRWNAGKREFEVIKIFPDAPLSDGVIPRDGTDGGLVTDVMEAVLAPAFQNENGEPLVAVGADVETVLGLYAAGDGTFHWHELNVVPHMPDIPGPVLGSAYSITAVGSFDGNSIYAGTNNGKVFRLDASSGWSVTDLSNPAIKTSVTHFAVPSADTTYLLTDKAVFRLEPGGWHALPGKVVPPGTEGVLPVPDGSSVYSGIQAEPGNPASVYVSSDMGVWRSEDCGDSWFDFSTGLPSVSQIGDLRLVTESSGVSFLYAGTFGWSVLRRPLGWDAFLKPVHVDGHMDLVDNVVFGSAPRASPVFSGTISLGPLHPFEEMDFGGDDGEFRVELKLHLEWKIDFSVVVKVDAQLIDNSDSDVDVSAGDSFTVPLYGAYKEVIDMETGELSSDQAHIEFTVSNG